MSLLLYSIDSNSFTYIMDQRFIPSDFGCDEDKIRGLPPFQGILDDKKSIRKAIEAAEIPYTYLTSTCLATYFLSLLRHPPETSDKETIIIYGSGEAKVSFTCEKDVGLYTIKVATDERTLNRAVMCRPPKNIASQFDLAFLWEAKTGRRFNKVHISEEDLVKLSETLPHSKNVRAAIIHSIFVDGGTMVETRSDDLEVSLLYHDFTYTTLEDIIDELLINPPKFQYINL